MADGTVKVKIGADTSAYNREMKKARKTALDFGSAFKSIATGIGSYLAVDSIIAFGTQAVQTFADAEQKGTKLLVALQNNQGAYERLTYLAAQLQQKTLFDDDATKEAMAMLASLGMNENQIKRLIPLVQDFAQLKGVDLSDAATTVGKSIASETNALKRYGISVEGAAGSSERLESVLHGLNDSVGGQAEAAANAGIGAITQLKNNWDDFLEYLGGKIAPALNAVAKKISQSMLDASGNTDTKTDTDALNAELTKYGNLSDKGDREKMRASYEKDAKTYFAAWQKAKNEGNDEARAHYATQYSIVKQFLDESDKLEKEFSNNTIRRIGDETVKKTGKINELAQSIKDLTELRDKAESPELIARISGRIESLQNEKKALEDSGKVIQSNLKANRDVVAILKEETDERKRQAEMKTFFETGKKVNNLAPRQTSSVDTEFNVNTNLTPGFWDQIEAGFAEFGESMQNARDISDVTTQSIRSSFTSMGVAIGEAFGNMITGTGDLSDFFSGLLGIVTDFMKQFGEALIASAVAGIAFQNLLANPYLALAAGVALVAAAAVVKSILTKGPDQKSGAVSGPRAFADGGIVFGPTIGLLGEYSNASRNPEIIAPLSDLQSILGQSGSGNNYLYGRLQGDDIRISNKRSDYRHSRISGKS